MLFNYTNTGQTLSGETVPFIDLLKLLCGSVTSKKVTVWDYVIKKKSKVAGIFFIYSEKQKCGGGVVFANGILKNELFRENLVFFLHIYQSKYS